MANWVIDIMSSDRSFSKIIIITTDSPELDNVAAVAKRLANTDIWLLEDEFGVMAIHRDHMYSYSVQKSNSPGRYKLI